VSIHPTLPSRLERYENRMTEADPSPVYPLPKPLVLPDTDECQQYDVEEVMGHLILGDALKVLKKLPAECADLVFIDPPYFLQLPKKRLTRWKVDSAVNGVDDAWDKFASFEVYDHFIHDLLVEVRRVMKPTATLWVIATYHCLFRIGSRMQDMGFWILNDVIWHKTNPMPNWLGVRFTNATETLIWALRDKNAKGYAFHRDQAKALGAGKVGANVWSLPICTGKERLKDGDGKKVHSTQKPVELLRRVILTASNPGDVVLDPVAGVGTSGCVAHALGRRFIMVEVNPRYAAAAAGRFDAAPKFRDSSE
jgi:DNA modification methylase